MNTEKPEPLNWQSVNKSLLEVPKRRYAI